MFKGLFGGSRVLKRMNPLMELYSYSKNSEKTYKELMALEPLAKTKGEKAMFNLNRAGLLYDMYKYREAADVMREIPSINPEFDAQCARMKTRIMAAMTRGEHR